MGCLSSIVSNIIYDKFKPNKTYKAINEVNAKADISLHNDELLIEGQTAITNILISTENKIDISTNFLATINYNIECVSESINIDSRDFTKQLENIPVTNGQSKATNTVNTWYNNKEISLLNRELLSAHINVFFRNNKNLTDKIDQLKKQGNIKQAEELENIQKYKSAKDAKSIRNICSTKKEHQRDEYLLILKQSVQALQTIYAIEDTDELYTELITIEPIPENYLKYSYFLFNTHNYQEAIIYANKALTILQTINIETNQPEIARSLSLLGTLHMVCEEYTQASIEFVRAINIYKLINDNSQEHLIHIKNNLNNLGRINIYQKNFSQAQTYLEESQALGNKIIDKTTTGYLLTTANTINGFAELYIRQGKTDLSNIYYNKTIDILQNTTNEMLKALSTEAMMNIANTHFRQKQYQQSLIELENVLQCYSEFVDNIQELNMYSPLIAHTLESLGCLNTELKNFDKAGEQFETALRIIRQMINANYRNVNIEDERKILNNLSFVYLQKKDLPRCVEVEEESLIIYKTLFKNKPKIYRPKIAQTLNMLMLSHIQLNNIKDSLVTYKELIIVYNNLFKQDPETYAANYASTLIIGVQKLNQDQNNLLIAYKILVKYPNSPFAQQLLDNINTKLYIYNPNKDNTTTTNASSTK